ncbi:MAG TPA: PLP-dependent aminotransferase family protein [Chloroflexota bacterium]
MDLTLTIDDSLPLHRQVREGLKGAILAGRLAPGQKLPSTRSLARTLSVSRTTVCQAYDAMEAEGYLSGKRGSGTYVSDELPEGVPMEGALVPTDGSGRSAPRALSSRFRARPRSSEFRLEGRPAGRRGLRYDFHPGQGAWDLFPREAWRRLVARPWRSAWLEVMDYGDPAGFGPLREEVAGYLARSRAVVCAPDQVVVVNGTQQALDLLARILLDPGDSVAVEDPGYPSAREVFASYGARLVPIPVGPDGMEMEPLRESRAKVALVAPSHQFPTGTTMTLPRRLSLLRWARRSGALVVEDDYDSEFRFGGRPLASLQGLDAGASVVYLGSFSKVLFPSLRVGYAVLPRDLVAPFVAAKELTDRQTPILEQRVLADFMREGLFDRHVRRMREVYRARRAALVAALDEYLSGSVEVMGSSAGMHMMVRLRASEVEEEVVERAARAGVGVYPAGPCFATASPFPALVLGYAGMDEKDLRGGVARLAGALRLPEEARKSPGR